MRRRRLSTTLAAAMIAAMLGCARPSPPAPSLACRVDAEFRRLARLVEWPDFEPAGMPLAVHDGDSTWVFAFPTALPGFTPARGCPGAQHMPGQHADVRANSSIEWDGIAVATVLAHGSVADSATALAATAIHEAFHAHQRAHHPGWIADEGALFVYPADDDTLLAWAKIEFEAMRRGIQATDRGESAGWAAAAVAARARRAARMPPAALAYERANELQEGLAQYIERRTLEAGTGAAPGARAGLRDDFPADGVRWRCYASGEAWALLLDRHVPGWQRHLARHDSLALDVMVARSGAVVRATPRELDGATRARLESAARHAVAALRETRIEAGRRFMAQRGHTLVFEAATEPWWPERFDPLNVQVLNDGVVLHRRWLRLGNATDRIEILDRTALTEPAGAHPLFHGVRRVVVAALDSFPALVAGDSALAVRAPGVRATLARGVVATHGSTTIVRAGP